MTTTTATDCKEHTYTDETEAHRKRREFIRLGFSVSLIAYDPSRERFVFDVFF